MKINPAPALDETLTNETHSHAPTIDTLSEPNKPKLITEEKNKSSESLISSLSNSSHEKSSTSIKKYFLPKVSSQSSIESNNSLPIVLDSNKAILFIDKMNDSPKCSLKNRSDSLQNTLVPPQTEPFNGHNSISNEDDVLNNKEMPDRKLSENLSINSELTESNEKLKIQSVVEAIGFFIFPSTGFINLAFRELLMDMKLFESFQ